MAILKKLTALIVIISIYTLLPSNAMYGHPQDEMDWTATFEEENTVLSLTPMTDPLVRVDTVLCKVGEIPFTSSVSQSGGKTYEIPIDVYPGVMGMQPNLALSYDSQMGQSLVGVGWTLKGISAITRTPRTPFHDGMATGIKMGSSDGYMLEGCRLLFVPSTGSDIVYETEQGNIMVKAHMDGDVTLYFEAFYPDGRKGVYGFTDNTQNRTSYPLTRMEDIHGNTVIYTYTYSGNSYRPLSICYNGCFVDFTYETRGDPVTMYVGGIKMTTDVRLKTIKTRIVNTEYGTYTLNYTDNDKISLLSSIHYSVGVTSRLNPLRFFYGGGAEEGENLTVTTSSLDEWPETGDNPDKFQTTTGRFGNGLSNESLLVYEGAVPYWQVSSDKFINKYDARKQILIYPSTKTGISSTPYKMNIGNGFVEIFPVNGTGTREGSLACVRNYVSGTSDRISISVFTVTEANGIQTGYTRYFDFTTLLTDKTGVKSVQPKLFYPGDFDGDGRTEILVMAIPVMNLPAKCYVISPEDNKILYQGTLTDFLYSFPGDSYPFPTGARDASDKFFAIDYDGDGKTDLCHVGYKGATFYTFETQGSGTRWSKLPTDPTLTQTFLRNRTYLPGDYNGDGLVDLLITPELDESQDKTWTLMTAKGNGYWEKSTFSGPLNKSDNNYGFSPVDIDNDGVHDLLCHSEKDVSVYRNICGTFSSTPVKKSYDKELQIPIILRIKSDGKPATAFATVRDGDMRMYSFSTNQSEDVLLSAMASSLGVVEKNEYARLDDESADIYSSAANVTYPYTPFREHLSVISRSETWMNRGMTGALSYRYQNGVFHTQGLGFCGFEKITIENERGQKTEQVYEPCHRGVLKSLKTPSREVTYAHDIKQKYNGYKVLSITLRESLEKDLLKNTKVYQDYKYDVDGNVITMNSQFDDGTIIITSNTYESNRELETGHFLGYLKAQDIETKKDGETVKEGMRVLSYDRLSPLRRYFTYNGNIVKEEKFEYDAKGNPIKQSVRNYTSTVWHTSTLSYDGHGRLVRETDPFGLETSMSFNQAGVKASSTDELGNTTVYTYDPFRREIERTTPDGVKTATSYSWHTYASGGMYSVRVKSDTDPAYIKVYDNMNREIRSMSECYDGQYLISQTIYDKWGNISRESFPTKSSVNPVWTYYYYDQYDRIITSHDASGRTTTYSYSGNTVTVKDREVERKFTYDGMDRLSSVRDMAGTVSYTYDPKGNPVKITSPGNAVTTYTYDKYGRRSSMEDAASGKTSWEYDTEGNVSKETDARGLEKRYTYDTHNRIMTKVAPEFTTTYIYDEYNRVSEVSSGNNTKTSYSYDDLGRLSQFKETTPDASLIKRYAYADGLLASLTYVTGQKTSLKESYLYKRGHHTKTVLNDTLTIYELKGENINGLKARIASGPLTKSYTYSRYCIPTGRSVVKGTETIWNEKYVFDPLTLNLTSRSNILHGTSEAFSYDPLNRLTGYGDETATYSANGNILSKSDVGEFSYDNSSRPYAVTGADTSAGRISTAIQQAAYTSFERPSHVSQGEWKYSFTYNGSYDKVRSCLYRNSSLMEQRDFLGGIYEYHQYRLILSPIQPFVADDEESAIVKPFMRSEELFYLGGDYYSSDVVGVVSSGKLHVYYLLRDYLGSIVGITDSNGNIIQELSYDAWGNQRSPETLEVFTGDSYVTPKFGRGYTGHTHLFRVGLIDMNARLYDPVVSRFLSPDPFVQAPEDSQNFNRYTYCLNNPLCYVDESGEIVWWAVGAAVGGLFNLVDKCMSGQVNNFWDGLTAFGIGAVSGALGGYVGGLGAGLLGTMASGAIGGAVGGALGSAVGMIAESALNTYRFGDPRLSIKELAMGTLMGAITGGVMNGIVAEMNGRNFYTGKAVAVELQTTISPMKMSEVPDVNPKFNVEGPDINFASKPSISPENREKYLKIWETLMEGKNNAVIEEGKKFQLYHRVLENDKQKLHFRYEIHQDLDKVFGKEYGVTKDMFVRHMNIEYFEWGKLKNGKMGWVRTPLKGQTQTNIHLFNGIADHYKDFPGLPPGVKLPKTYP